MKTTPTYKQDHEFRKLLSRRADIDLPIAALELARDAHPQLEFDPTLQWIRDRGKDLVAPVTKARSERAAIELLANHLAQTHGIFGDKQAYEEVESSYLPHVIETKRGIPISLSLLYMAVAAEVGLELHGVASPLHFLARYESADGPLFIDAYSKGRILGERECLDWLQEISKLPLRKIKPTLKPAQPRTIVIRMLNNLKAMHARDGSWRAAWLVQHRLSAMQPAAYDERRDLALISLKANRAGEAINLIESCLRNCPDDEKPILEAHLTEARQQMVRWN